MQHIAPVKLFKMMEKKTYGQQHNEASLVKNKTHTQQRNIFNRKRKNPNCSVLNINKKETLFYFQALLLSRAGVIKKGIGALLSPKKLGRAMFHEEYKDVQFVSIFRRCLLIRRLITATCTLKLWALGCASNNLNDGSMSLTSLVMDFCSQSESLVQLCICSLIARSKREQDAGSCLVVGKWNE